jgi:hypothetical protein
MTNGQAWVSHVVVVVMQLSQVYNYGHQCDYMIKVMTMLHGCIF